VTVLLSFCVCVIGAVFRFAIGPDAGEELLSDRCGFDGDHINARGYEEVINDFPECAITHRLYAAEYCPTVISCSFTVFRCIIGDCSSRGGQSLPAHFSAGYGLTFDFAYGFGMVVLIFGLFNVITAVFVESTMKGLAAQDSIVKRQKKYRVTHVKRALWKLVQRIAVISDTYQNSHDVDEEQQSAESKMSDVFKSIFDSAWLQPRQAERFQPSHTIDATEITLSEPAFNEVLKDEGVQSILDDLDIDLGTDSSSVFRIFEKDRKGQLPLVKMLDTLMLLRGSTSKVDFLGPSVMIQGLRDELRHDVHKIQEMVLVTRRAIGTCQHQIQNLADER